MNAMIRTVDELSRIVLPKQMLAQIGAADPATHHVSLELTVQGNSIVLRPAQNHCCICSSTTNTRKVKDKYLCADCIAAIRTENEDT